MSIRASIPKCALCLQQCELNGLHNVLHHKVEPSFCCSAEKCQAVGRNLILQSILYSDSRSVSLIQWIQTLGGFKIPPVLPVCVSVTFRGAYRNIFTQFDEVWRSSPQLPPLPPDLYPPPPPCLSVLLWVFPSVSFFLMSPSQIYWAADCSLCWRTAETTSLTSRLQEEVREQDQTDLLNISDCNCNL